MAWIIILYEISQGKSLCQRPSFVLSTDKAESAKREPRAEGVSNESFSSSKVCDVMYSLWFPVIQWLQVAINGIIQIYGQLHRLQGKGVKKGLLCRCYHY